MIVVAEGGQFIHPVTVHEFRIATAETFDVLVSHGPGCIRDLRPGQRRTGYARGALAVHHGLEPAVPALVPLPLLTTADMGHGEQGPAPMDQGATVT